MLSLGFGGWDTCASMLSGQTVVRFLKACGFVVILYHHPSLFIFLFGGRSFDMGDPFSIASGIVGVVSLGVTVCGGLHTYFSALKDRGEDVERACELLSLLRKYIELVRPSAPTLSNQYAQASDLVTMALRLCEGELQALERTISKLSRGKGAWEKSKSAVTYPLNQTKLVQVQDRLFRATGVLGTVVQILIL